MPLPQSAHILGRYLFNGDATDASGNGRDLSSSGTPAFAAGLWGRQCASFDAAGDIFETALSAFNFAADSQFTLAGWVYRPASGGSAPAVFNKHLLGDTFGGYLLDVLYSGGQYFARFGMGASFVSSDHGLRSAAIATGQWVHLAGVKSGSSYAPGNLALYVNGSPVTGSTSGSGGTSAIPTTQAAWSGISSVHSGEQKNQDVTVWDVALSAAEVAELYTSYFTYYPPTAAQGLDGVAPQFVPRVAPTATLGLASFVPNYGVVFYPEAAALTVTAVNLAALDGDTLLPTAALGLNGAAPWFTSVMAAPSGTVSLTAVAPGELAADVTAPGATLELAGVNPARWYAQPSETVDLQRVYRLVLTGAPDGTTDVALAMASFQARYRLAAQTCVEAVVPRTTETATAVSARPNGEMVVYGGYRNPSTGAVQWQELLRVTLTRLDTDRGARNASITLAGYADAVPLVGEYGEPIFVTREMAGVSYSRAGSPNQLRCSVDYFLRPGDTARDAFTGTEVVANSITYLVSPSRQEMTVSDGNG